MAHPSTNLTPPPHVARLPLFSGPVASMGVALVLGAALLLAVVWAITGPVPGALALAAVGFAVGAVLVLGLMRRGYPHPGLGLCNLVTLARLVLTAALLAPLVAPAPGWSVLALAVLAFSLDGVDGWLARREGRVSDFGARFDMEVDAALGLVLALNAWAAGNIGLAVLVLGLPRYAFVASAWVWPWMARPLPDRFGRKVACVIQIAALIGLQAPLVAGWPAVALLAGAAAALGWSFGRDIFWLWRARS